MKVFVKFVISAILGLLLPTVAFIYFNQSAIRPSPVTAGAPEIVDLPMPRSVSDPIVIAIAGDTMLGDAGRKVLAKRGFDYPFSKVTGLIADADFAIVNAEAPITSYRKKIEFWKKYVYRSNPRALSAFVNAGIDAVTLANNHVLDYRYAGFSDFLRRLKKAGMHYFGGGSDEASARRPLVLDFQTVRVALLNYMDNYGPYYGVYAFFAEDDRGGIAMLTEQNLARDIASAREDADVVVAIIHAGDNYKPVTRVQERYARYAIDAGADVVIGHHPHIYQEAELYRGKPILYSLGNFVFNTPGKDWFRYGIVARLIVEGKKLSRIELVPIVTQNRIVKFQPRPAVGEELDEFFDKFIPASAKRGAKITKRGDIGLFNLTDSAAPSE